LLSNHTWVTLQDRCPESISQDRRALGGWAIIRNGEEAPRDGVKPHHFEVVSADDAGLDDSRFAEADHRESNRRELGDLRKRLRPFAQILDFRNRESRVVVADASGALPYIYKVGLVAIRQGPQQHPPDNTEDRGIGADSQRQRQYDRDRKSLRHP